MNKLRWCKSIFGLSAALVLAAAPVLAQEAAPAHEMTKADVDAWLDGFLPFALDRANIPGAVVIITKNGETLTERGFGYSDVAARKPVDPALTLFRPGSISKLFTWTAVMQLVEQGKIDLDGPINQYLDYSLPDWNGKPITMRNLMTHTPGFEDSYRGLIVPEPAAPYTLESVLKDTIPVQTYEPGTTPAYSNYGSGVAGYVVQRLSGERFEDYIQKHIFEPLHMNHSTFMQPLPDNLKPLMSQGYAPGTRKPGPFENIRIPPAGALAASAEDMAKFMNAHLHHGAGLLKPETADMMHSTMLTILPQIRRMALGFMELDHGGHRIIGHDGGTTQFHSQLSLLLDDDIGIFISMNSPDIQHASRAIPNALVDNFVDRYFPTAKADPSLVDAKDAAEHAKMMVGTYIRSRRADSTYRRAGEFFNQQHVSLDAKGRLVTSPTDRRNWVEVAPFLWWDRGSDTKIAAKVVDGKVVMWGGWQDNVSLPVPWYRQSDWIRPATYAALIALLLTALFWPSAALVRRNYSAKQTLVGGELIAYRAMSVLSALGVALFVSWYSVLGLGAGDAMTWGSEIGSWVILPVLVLVSFWNASVVLKGDRSTGARIWSVILVLSSAMVLWTGIIFRLFYLGLA